MSQKSFKEFGMQYLNEMASMREQSKHEISIGILNLKNNAIKSGGHISHSDFENFIDASKNTVEKVFDGEFTKLTLKSLTKMKQVLSGAQNVGFNPDEDEAAKNELEKVKNELEYYTDLVEKIKSEKVEEKAAYEIKIDGMIMANSELEDKIGSLKLEKEKLGKLIETTQNELSDTKNQLAEVNRELTVQTQALTELAQVKSVQTDDLQNLMDNFGEKITIVEEEQEERQNKAIEEATEKIKQELFLEHEIVTKDFEQKLEREKQKRRVAEANLAKVQEEFDDTMEKMNKDYRDLKLSIDSSGKTLNFIQSMLSSHPLYSSVLILANLGGTLPLQTLAKTVGAAPIRLRHLLDELVERKLISIGEGDNPEVKIIRDY